ncbi:MAG: cohesin domain-containing protein [bacterium]|nr:cohesin domain-containing protein [bacterium]
MFPKHKTISKIFPLFFSLAFISPYFGLSQDALAESSGAVSGKTSLLISPSVETVLVGSTFDVSVFLDTRGNSINAVELNLKFSQEKLSIVKPSGGKSFFSIWSAPPTYSNTEGRASFIGGIVNGITTGNGLITTITFKANASGQAVVEVLPSSKILTNDALGANIISEFGRGVYTISPKSPEGPKVFSQTHPSGDRWYNNNNPILTWEKEPGVTDFSFELSDKPQTVPDNVADTQDTITSFENVGDGVRYFHIKALKEGIWGSITHFPLYIDTTPPISFKPKIEVLTAAIIDRALVSFSTTDLLSGVDHYEVGIIDKTKSPLESPSFIEAESPYQLPAFISGNLVVIVRAQDRAGNVRDESADIYVPLALKTIFIITLSIIFLLILLHYLFGHKIISRFKRALGLLKKEEKEKDELNKF